MVSAYPHFILTQKLRKVFFHIKVQVNLSIGMDPETPPVLGSSYAVYDEARSPITPTVERPAPGASMQYYQQDENATLYVGPSEVSSTNLISQIILMAILGACYVFFGVYFLIVDKNKVKAEIKCARRHMCNIFLINRVAHAQIARERLFGSIQYYRC
jgi:hypothetical protein